MNKETAVKKITVAIVGKTFELTPEEARKLQMELDNLLGARQVVNVYPAAPTPTYVPVIYRDNTAPIWPQYPTINCGNDSRFDSTCTTGLIQFIN